MTTLGHCPPPPCTAEPPMAATQSEVSVSAQTHTGYPPPSQKPDASEVPEMCKTVLSPFLYENYVSKNT